MFLVPAFNLYIYSKNKKTGEEIFTPEIFNI